MRRREFVAGLGSAVAWPLAGSAQQPATPVIGFLNIASQSTAPVIGFLDWRPPRPNAPDITEFRRGLAEAGFVEGQNVSIEFRWVAGRYDQLRTLAYDLVSRQVAVIVAAGALPTARAAKAVTATIPIVVAAGGDPVREGLAASLKRPGGNVTGMTMIAGELVSKRLDFLHKVAPQAIKVAYLSGGPRGLKDEESDVVAAARQFGLQVIIIEAPSDREIESAFASLAQRGAEALIVGVVAHFTFNNKRIVALAERYKIPAVYPFGVYTSGGGLMSYDTDYADMLHQVGVDYVGPILKGAKPADLPIRQPTKFSLVINRKTAKALGLEIPEVLLAIADRVIE
jgi:putative tryptophan/tyrosine transport system substrate-binding protein